MAGESVDAFIEAATETVQAGETLLASLACLAACGDECRIAFEQFEGVATA